MQKSSCCARGRVTAERTDAAHISDSGEERREGEEGRSDSWVDFPSVVVAALQGVHSSAHFGEDKMQSASKHSSLIIAKQLG